MRKDVENNDMQKRPNGAMKNEVDQPFSQMQKECCFFSFADLFCGIGGIRLPFQELGGECVFSSEIDDNAKKTYFSNYGEWPQGDISEIDARSVADFDILLAGFPCQPFSQAGKKKGFEDSRGTLFFEIARFLQQKRPHAFLLENVKQLRGHDKGNTLSTILRWLRSLNYYVTFEVLRAADFGLPQNRERIYIVGFDREYYQIDDRYQFTFPLPQKILTRLGDILETNVDPKYTISDKLYKGHLRRKSAHLEKGNGFGFSLFTADSPYTNTLSARYYKDGSEILIDQGENKNPRKLTPRECARLQGFPEKFIIPVSDTQAYRQFGNSVAVPVIREMAVRMIEEMNKLQVNRSTEELHFAQCIDL